MPETLENHVRQFREERGWTQAQLAEEMGVSRKTVNTVENGISRSLVFSILVSHVCYSSSELWSELCNTCFCCHR